MNNDQEPTDEGYPRHLLHFLVDDAPINDPNLTFMLNTLEQLLKKQFLYPVLLMKKNGYQNWFEEHELNTDEEDLARYKKQYEILLQMCEEFESQNDADTEDQKKAQRKRIIELMIEIDDYGSAPDGIITGLADVLEEDLCATM